MKRKEGREGEKEGRKEERKEGNKKECLMTGGRVSITKNLDSCCAQRSMRSYPLPKSLQKPHGS